MVNNTTDIKTKMDTIRSLSSDYDYLRSEFNEKLWATQDGCVDLDAFLKFCKEYDWLVEHILQFSNKLNSI